MKAYEESKFTSGAKRMRQAAHPDVEEALSKWLCQARSKDIPLSGTILQAKAESLAKELGHADFKCSQGWLTRFKTRKDIKFKSITGEARSVNIGGYRMEKQSSPGDFKGVQPREHIQC